VSRHDLLERILAAQFELEYAEPEDLPRRRRELNSLLDKAISGTRLTHRI
jgi:hypothetical protein